ncbi:3-deoxy-8-phosphooctulonate synthase [Leuconostoc falkenbergense]|jgi:2-dehydro-3-deoxyphosphooctonate aldolase (KDO 8-P synthase)|uniref:3-deoxy-8-phosphooctulonate synthase n=2 Tax=Leuconostoc TaxID=1243 RepID=A0A9X3IP44_9LACO|nr:MULTISPECIES: 3-deoxy-8-phosphooctulonate synthase [Leuconostoc]KDA47259.1 2-Keto-3-deoxy-D-manno-octulosonate-8-phosphate synthase [Leuconostoc pseudomesenteroides 1159]KDA49086.1 2-Keto-3-deoxy-D-manno-octulosonate-8-phosphate synthase [Leuconostoc pseudomesenteroides PS12]CCJ66659.1 2-Keto-3-deoxy-D-manno-octulosonate-8-phosphate synthase [Leuconostoc pseudomesenteroides 4882]MCT4390146.1 3-deoxy-8-phosphooctulonate synthase [Leuconostoc falkenbergense]MCT4411405.1 3-deoxy-8-phosphooctul
MPQISDVFQDYGFKNDRLTLLAGPCAIESYETCAEVAETLKQITDELGINYVFKSSFDKANRSSIDSERGAGMASGLKVLAKIKENYHVPIVTDVHEPYQCEPVAEVADVLQIPAYLSRQTDLLLAAGKTGRVVNIKKAQFMAPEDIQTAVDKVATSNPHILVTERGTMFGYHQLVVDMTSLIQMRETGYPVIFDATHSVQVPSGYGNHSGGNRDYAFPLMRAALAIGIDGIFAEVHPNPPKAISDQDSQLYLSKIRPILENANRLFHEHLEMKAVYAHDDLL